MKAFRFDPDRCTGCQACAVACWMENRSRQAKPWRRLVTFNPIQMPGQGRYHVSLACHHCDDPACLKACPVQAYSQNPLTGAVVVDRDRCIGCRYCTWACPHGAPAFEEAAGTVSKCTFCEERLARGEEPACVARCPLEALQVVDREPGACAPGPGIPGPDTRPALQILASRRGALVIAPEPPPVRNLAALLALPEARITLQGEWTLLLFTTTLAFLAAWSLAAASGHTSLHPAGFAGAGALAMGVSAAHLGRPLRAWRAIANVGSSWLSREILLVSAFLGVGALSALGLPGLAWPAAAAGLVALFAVDRIYRVALRQGPWNLHSGHALANGLYQGGLWMGLPWLWLPVGLLKLGLFLHRKASTGLRRPGWSLVRVILGFVAPAVVLLAQGPVLAAVVLALAGDLVDRGEYYEDLRLPSPEASLREELLGR